MKKKKLNKKAVGIGAAVLCALLLLKAVLAPANVGKMGDVTITAGVYKMAQFQAYQSALNVATEQQAAMTTGQFLNEQIAVDENGNPVAVEDHEDHDHEDEAAEQTEQTLVTVKDFVAAETERLLRDYAAVEGRFAALNGTLTEEQTAEADEYAAQVWESYGALYYNNGIRLKDIKAFEYNYFKAQQLLPLIYGTNGETPVGEEVLMDTLTEEGIYGSYVMVPLYNTSTYAFATTEQMTEMEQKAQAIVDEYNGTAVSAQPTGEAAQAAFTDALMAGLADVYGVLDVEYDPAETLESELFTDLFLKDELASAMSEEDAAALSALQPGEAAVVQYSYYGLMIFLRGDALEEKTLADWEPVLLSHLKSAELTEALETAADELTNGLKGYARSAYSARSISLMY